MPATYLGDEYLADLFVPRDELAGRVSACLQNTGPGVSRVVSLVAPPGAGKTWLMKNLQDQLRSYQHLVVWLDVSRLTNDDGLLQPDRARAWLGDVKREAAKLCTEVNGVLLEDCEIARCVQRLVERLCEHCNLDKWPLVLIDGYDEFQTNSLITFERQILERLLDGDCIRIVICRRYDQKFTSGRLHRGQTKVGWEEVYSDVFLAKPGSTPRKKTTVSPAFALQFTRTRDTLFSASPIQAADLLKSLTGYISNYRWNHPFINAFLFNLILTRSKGCDLYRLVPLDLTECCRELINRPEPHSGHPRRYPPISDKAFALMKQIADEVPDRWSEASLRIAGIELSLASAQFSDFLHSGAIVYCGEDDASAGLARFRIADGLRELLRDLCRMERNP